jgi:beta-glucanase (GH16 family)
MERNMLTKYIPFILFPALILLAFGGARADEAAKVAPATLAGREFLSIAGEQWKLLWHDEFDGEKLDNSKWSIGLPWGGTDGTGRHHNDQYASYIMDDDINLRGGQLHLTAQRRDVKDAKGKTFSFTQGLITTNKSFRATHGYFEVLARMPTEAGPGTWPAFWTLSDGWPPEFDIIEYWGSDNRIHQGTVTKKPDGGQRWDSYHKQQASVTGWHTYGLEWGPGYQLYNIDGKINNAIYGAHLLPDKSHYLLLNSGVDAKRPPRPGTIFPNDFIVEYVRVYARPDVPALLNGSFEHEAPAPWTRWNEAAIVDYDARGGRRCARVDSGGKGENTSSSMQQTVYGLKPSTRYTLRGFAKTTGGAMAKLGVKEYGGAEVLSSDSVTGAGSYRPLSLSFNTGAQATSATIFCWSESEGAAFFDDIVLERVVRETP